MFLSELIGHWTEKWTMIYLIGRKFGKEKFGEFTCFEHLENVWQINRFSQKVIIVSRNLDGFSLANQWFAKFAKLSPHQSFLLYGMWLILENQPFTHISGFKEK